ncbi:MAG: protein mraZ [Bacteroidales bacterium]|nr:protein mraZ [Bacteroidales bacterium]
MFVGDYVSKLDNKCRVIFPSQLKRQVPEEEQGAAFILKRDVYEKCLVLYTMSEWNRYTEFLRNKLNPFNRRHALLLRELYRGSAEVYLDNNSRFLIPKALLEYIGDEKELIFAGQEGKVEIWCKTLYIERALRGEDVEQLTEELLGGDDKKSEESK